MTNNGDRPTAILRCKEVLRMVRFSRATLYRLMAKREFPQQHNLSPGTVGWSAAEVNAWIAATLGSSEEARTGPDDSGR